MSRQRPHKRTFRKTGKTVNAGRGRVIRITYCIKCPYYGLKHSECRKCPLKGIVEVCVIPNSISGQSKKPIEVELMVGRLFDIAHGVEVESRGYSVLNYPQLNRTEIKTKPLFTVGSLLNFFPKNVRHVKIKNIHGLVVRDMKLKGDRVFVDPGGGDPVLNLSVHTEVLYEPWFMDAGSLIIHSPQEVLEFVVGTKLKIATENDVWIPIFEKPPRKGTASRRLNSSP